MKFTFGDIYPDDLGVQTSERGIPEVEDKSALGVDVVEDNGVRNTIIWFIILFGALIAFRYI